MPPAVEKGNIVKVHYTGTFDDGEVFDSSEGREPLEFEAGAQMVVPGFDNAVIGKSLGEEFSVHLSPEEAYGPYNDEAIQIIEKSEFPADVKPEVGMMLQVQQQHGDHSHPIPVVIKKIEAEKVTLDFNHPLAGKTLEFDVKIAGIE